MAQDKTSTQETLAAGSLEKSPDEIKYHRVLAYLLECNVFDEKASLNRGKNTLFKNYHKANPPAPGQEFELEAKPDFTDDELESILNSSMKAKFCQLLIQNRNAFADATIAGDGYQWKKEYKDRIKYVFIDQYDSLVQWIFEANSNDVAVAPKKIRALVLDILDMAQNNLQIKARSTFKPIMVELLNLAFNPETNPADKLFVEMRIAFIDKPEITNILDRLYKGSNSYNPYYMGCSKKLNTVLGALQEIKNNAQEVDVVLKDKKSNLYKAINHQRINFFKSTAHSMDVYTTFKAQNGRDNAASKETKNCVV